MTRNRKSGESLIPVQIEIERPLYLRLRRLAAERKVSMASLLREWITPELLALPELPEKPHPRIAS